MDLTQLNKDDMKHIGYQWLNNYRNGFNSFEAISQQLVDDIYNTFHMPDGSPAFALVRIFRASRFDELSSESRALTQVQAHFYLALTASIGQESAWCDRHQSQHHQVIPVNANMSPMFKGIFKELGFAWEDHTDDLLPEGQNLDLNIVRYFLVPDASASTAITDQEQFVKPYGIRSVIAIGSNFLSGAAYTLIAFSRVPITEENAKIYAVLASFASTLLAIHEGQKPLWED